jgi:hypothetical protein
MLAVFWRDIVLAVLPTAQVSAGAGEELLAAAEQRLGRRFPEDLAGLLRETDGVRGDDGLDAIWPVERIVRDNVPAGDLLYFGDNGGGDRFAYRPGDPSGAILVCDHETGERRPVATNLADYLTRVLTAEGDEWYDAPA